MIRMKGSFAQVIKPVSEKVLESYLKSWQYWGKVEADYENIWTQDEKGNKELTGFTIDVQTSRGKYRHTFKRNIDTDGFFVWEEVKVEEIKG